MPRKTAFLFPGQGSQFVGMGKEIYDERPSVQYIFENVDKICGKSISGLGFEGPMDELTSTENLQPAVTAVSLACFALLKEAGIQPDIVAGHSVGEYAALFSAGVVTVENALKLAMKRGELMNREAIKNPGAMAAIIGLDIAEVMEIVDESKGDDILTVANHNTEKQIVISGQKEPVSRAIKLADDRKAKAIPLNVSGAWHSELMVDAVDELRQFMKLPFSEPVCPMLFNATAETETDGEKIKDIMARQLVRPVRWYDIMTGMLDQGVNTFVEVGPKKVLSGLIRKIAPSPKEITILNVQDIKSLDKAIDVL
jgi:[acyl-carrier-protein] S-malonyltransferase